MQLERLKVWQWCIVGAVVGCAVAMVMLHGGPSEPRELATCTPHAFEQQLIHRRDPTRAMVGDISNVVLHPETDDVPLPNNPRGRAQFVTYIAYLDTGKRNPQGKPLFKVSPH